MTEAEARRRDEADPSWRDWFHIPPAEGGRYPEAAYLAGNSLGLPPKDTQPELLADLEAWARLGVAGHTTGERPWLPYHRRLTKPPAWLLGSLPHETRMMTSLTVNLQLLMVSCYRPAGVRAGIVIGDPELSSGCYAVRSQARCHGLDPDTTVVRLAPGPGEDV